MEKMIKQSGVTLLELMIVLGIVAILVSIATPDMGVATQQRRIASTAATLQDALASARTQAVMRSAVVSLQGVNGGSWLSGVQSFVPNNGQGGQALANADTALETFTINSPPGITLNTENGAPDVLSFNNLGGLDAGGTFSLAICSNDSRVKQGINLQINAAGRVKQGIEECN